jgi:hypothetical protein
MLFDLRGRGRRRTVQAIYLGLALLMGVGLVGFGIGGGFGGGGLFNAVTNTNGSSSSFSDKVKADQKATVRNPSSVAAWANLTHDAYAEAGATGNYDTNTGQFTASGRQVLGQAKLAWDQYLTLNPKNPDPDLANLMVQAFSAPGGLNDPASAVRALQIVIASRPPTLTLYEDLAALSYQANNPREGDLAAARAVQLSPPAQRASLQAQFAQLKKNPNGTPSATGAGAAGAAGGATVQTATTVTAAPSTPATSGSGAKKSTKTGK